MSIYVISASPDGFSVTPYSESAFLEALNSGEEFGNPPNFLKEKDLSEIDCVEGICVIRGEIIVPKKEEVVTKYKI